MAPIGFIGIGNMGFYMARNLLNCSRKIIVYDSDPRALINIKKLGAQIARSPSELASQCTEIITMLPSKVEVDDAFCRKEGILSSILAGTLCVDCSMVEHTFAKEMARKVGMKTAHYVDAPVSGGVLGAREATLTFMVGGDHLSFQRARAILPWMGRHILHCGPVGSGQVAKLCITLLFSIQLIGVSEALNLAATLGVNPELMTSIINQSSGRCFVSDTYNPVPGLNSGAPATHNYTRGKRCEHIAKDLGLAVDAAMSTRTAIPLGSLASQIYTMLGNSDVYKDLDVSVVIKYLKELKPISDSAENDFSEPLYNERFKLRSCC